jgi:DNA-binding CsgD family transcriptional regulator
MFEFLLQDLVGGTAGIEERAEGIAFLRVAKSVYPLTTVSYLGLNIPLQTHGRRYIQCTYSDRWAKHCVSKEAVDLGRLTGLAPALREALDWAEPAEPGHGSPLAHFAPKTRSGSQVLSIPLRSLTGEVGLFCIEADIPAEDWREQKPRLLTDFQTLANYFHQHILRIYGHNASNAILISARELDCLKWMAAGKTAWEASVILGISERTVRFHLNAAREKLNCLTTTQAVAKAVSQQLI